MKGKWRKAWRITLVCFTIASLLVLSACGAGDMENIQKPMDEETGDQESKQTIKFEISRSMHIAAGDNISFAIRADGSLWAWGSNFGGQLGDGTTKDRYDPVKIMDDVTAVASGKYHGLAVKTDGSLWAWGNNQYGQLGDGTISNDVVNTGIGNWWKDDKDKIIPVKIMEDVVSVKARIFHNLAIKADGTLWVWGINYGGYVGDGTATAYGADGWGKKEYKAKPVHIMNDVIFAAAGFSQNFAIKEDGSLWAWGNNQGGQLGDGTTIDRASPVKIMDDAIYVAAGTTGSFAIKEDGSLWAWGERRYEQLRDEAIIMDDDDNDESSALKTSTELSPVKIMEDVIYVVEGESHGIVIKEDGSLWTWGMNDYGQLGDGSEVKYRDIPVKIMDNMVSAAVGRSHTIAIAADGSLWAWGLGLGVGYEYRMYETPVKIMDIK